MRVLSLGGGVQSSTLALLADTDPAAVGGPVDVAIHSDTGWERQATINMVEWLRRTLTYPVVIVRNDLRGDLLAGTNSTGQKFLPIPAFDDDDSAGRRQCTREYKLDPITSAIRALLGVPAGHRVRTQVEVLIGFSTDEIRRVKPSRWTWQTNRHPLIDLGMSRQDCVVWWRDHAPASAPPLERSACIGCPLQSGADWRSLTPEQVADAVEVEDAIQRHHPGNRLTRWKVPLADALAASGAQMSLFDAECGGVCDT